MPIALALAVSLLAATAAFAQDIPDPPPPAAEAPAVDAAPQADAQSDAQARAAERCRAARNTESRLRSSRRQRCPAAVLRTDPAAPAPDIVQSEDDPAQSPMQPPVSQQPH